MTHTCKSTAQQSYRDRCKPCLDEGKDAVDLRADFHVAVHGIALQVVVLVHIQAVAVIGHNLDTGAASGMHAWMPTDDGQQGAALVACANMPCLACALHQANCSAAPGASPQLHMGGPPSTS